MRNPFLPSFRVLVAAIAATCLLTACTSETSWQEHVARASEYREKGDLQAAIIELKSALQERPDDADIRLALGRVYLELGDGESAEKELTLATELGEPLQSTMLDLTRAYLLQNKFEQVVKPLIDELTGGSKVLTGLPTEQRADLTALHGHALLALGKFKAAENRYDEALSLVPGSAEASLGKARLAMARGALEETRAWLDRTLKEQPEFGPAWRLLGDLERSQNNMAGAEAAYGHAVENESNKWQALLSRAFVRIARDDDEGAAQDLKTFRQAGARHPSASVAQGLLHYRAKELSKAQAEFEDALNMTPDYPPALFYLGVVHTLEGRTEQAQYLLQRLLAADPNFDAAAVVLGAARLIDEDFPGAQAALAPVRARRPNDTEVLRLLRTATLGRGGGNTDELLALIEQVVPREAAAVTAHLSSHVDAVSAGSAQTEAATRRIEEVGAADTDDPNRLLSIAVNELSSGDVAASTEALEKAIALDPELEGARTMLILDQVRNNELEAAMAGAKELVKRLPDRSIGYNVLGIVALAHKHTEAAEDAFRQALEIDPRDTDAANNLALVLFLDDRFDEARESFLKVLEHRPGHLGTLMRLAEIDSRRGDLETTVQWLEQAIAGNPDEPLPRAVLGRVYLREGRDIEALRLTESVAIRDDAPAALLRVLATAQLRQNRFRDAIPTLERLSNLQPDSAGVQQHLARAYHLVGRTEDALAASGRALSLDPTHQPTMYLRARILMAVRRLDEAQRLVASLKEVNEEGPDLLEMEGGIAIGQGKMDEGIAAYRRAFELRRHNVQLSKLAAALFTAGREDEGTAVLNEWLAEYPEDSMTLWTLASHHVILGQYVEAEAPLAKLVELHPDNADFRNELAWVLLRQERLPEAMEHATRAQELQPDDPQILDTLGNILLEMGETTRAVRMLRNAAEASAGDPSIRTNLARALFTAGQVEEAREMLSRALSNAQPFPNRAEAEGLLDTIRTASDN